ncbi:MAG: hypothetical protein EOM85_02165 [Candidatus Moranbacteria bacterium]|nr:hypothetical protein [Candidatus Moranbacteria bacterium]
MSEIFPKNLIMGSVKNTDDYKKIISENPKLSEKYIWIATYSEKSREFYESNWPKVEKYLDKNFLDKFKMESEHDSRAWEFHLASVFINEGLNLLEKTWDYGPDFCIQLENNKKIWVEAIICTLGDTDPVEPPPVIVPGKSYSFGGNIEDINRPKALRITSAIGTKFEKFKKYLEDPSCLVQKDDCLVIAINGNLIQHHSEAFRLFKYSVFGQGPDVLRKISGQEKLQGGYYKPVSTIKRKTTNGEMDIPITFMEMDEFSPISAVLYCGRSITDSLWNSKNLGDDFFFAYHTNPKNPIPDKTFKFGIGVTKDSKTNSITDRIQSE